ncbi:hypothetical protein DFH06DRAFT_1214202 [Mycena polygramma]|nr:hypothetical protein DFH06DRAFT_1214202 [Mycena polygramma]
MRFYKLRVTPNAANVASTFNEQFQPEIIAEHNDPYQLEWIKDGADVLVGDKALRLASPQESGYVVRWPIRGSNFNTRDYGSSVQAILADVETVLQHTLRDRLGIKPHDYKDYSVVLVIPDLYDRSYVREFANLLLVTMGFKQLCAQQESLAATYGAGLSSACVVDIGAVKTSVACVDEGLIIPDTRLNLNMGGDDITEFLQVLLERIHFPYRDINLARSYDWSVMDDLKARLCTLSEVPDINRFSSERRRLEPVRLCGSTTFQTGRKIWYSSSLGWSSSRKSKKTCSLSRIPTYPTTSSITLLTKLYYPFLPPVEGVR